MGVSVMSPEATKYSIGCSLCERIQQCLSGRSTDLIYETDDAIVVPGEHQFFKGYCVVILKQHAREMHNLEPAMAARYFSDVMKVGQSIQSYFNCLKINYASLGNIEEHIHWHVFPRYSSEVDPQAHPWKYADEFSHFLTNGADVSKLKQAFR